MHLTTMSQKKILITGMNGFIGSHLAKFFSNHHPDARIIGICRTADIDQSERQLISLDLSQQDELKKVLKQIQPDYIFHLAGKVFSYDFDELYHGNVKLTQHLFEAVKQADIKTKIVVAGSAAEYGKVEKAFLPIRETMAAYPQTPYGLTKLWQTQLAAYYAVKGVDVVVGRIFNVIGNHTATHLSTGDFFNQINRLKKSKIPNPLINVGDLSIKRDFVDIDDVSSGLIALAQYGESGQVYNICSGQSTDYQQILTLALSVANLDAKLIRDHQKSQNTYVADIYGANQKIKQATRWEPQIDLMSSIKKVINTSLT